MNRNKVKLLGFFLAAFVFSCAVQQYPTGGPTDSIPPELISSSVAPGTIHFSDNEIIFEFSEYMNKSSVQNSVFISPSLENQYELKWSGKEMTLHFLTELKKEVTYVVTIGTTAGDYNAGNKLSHSYAISFSTGDHIDSTEIKGLVIDEKKLKPFSGASVFAYRLSQNQNPNPAKDKADYITQSGTDGKFTLSFLKEDQYRIFAVDDQFKNELWDSTSEAIGVGEVFSIQSKKSADTSYTFFISTKDITPPSISGIVMESPYLAKVTFSEQIDWKNSNPNFSLLGENSKIEIEKWKLSPINHDQIFLQVDSLTDGNYQFVQNGISDLNFNRSDNDTTSFTYLYEPKTVKSLIQVYPSDSTKTLYPTEKTSFVFRSKFQIDSVKFFEKPVKKNSSWREISGLEFSNEKSFVQEISKSNGWNQEMKIKGYLFGERDTVSVSFTTFTPNETGAISGTIQPYIPGTAVYVELYQPSVNLVQSKTKFERGQFGINEIPSGKYVVSGFSDLNGNQKWDMGEVFPWKAAEPKYVVQDTISVRARWTVEDLKLKRW